MTKLDRVEQWRKLFSSMGVDPLECASGELFEVIAGGAQAESIGASFDLVWHDDDRQKVIEICQRIGLSEPEAIIAPLVAWCREHGVTPRFEILPREGDAGLTRELARLGFFASSFHTSLVRDTSPIAKAARSGDVEQVTTPAVLEEFLEAYCAGWGVPNSEGFKRNVRPWLGRKG